MHIALFDIDGTLTASNEIDSECRADAFRDVFGFELDINWDVYEHTTDRGIATQALREQGRVATEHDLSLDRARCVQLLTERMTNLQEIPGAGAFLPTSRSRLAHRTLHRRLGRLRAPKAVARRTPPRFADGIVR